MLHPFLLISLLLPCLLVSCAAPLSDEKEIEFSREQIGWTMQLLKLEDNRMKTDGLYFEMMNRGREVTPLFQLPDSLEKQIKEWKIASDLNSENSDKFLDKTDEWLDNIQKNRPQEQEAIAEWNKMKAEFEEILKEGKDLDALMTKKYFGMIEEEINRAKLKD